MEIFSWVPDYSAKRKKKPEAYTTSFGDGYTQRVGVGANKIIDNYDLVFSGDYIKIKAIDDFLVARDGNEDFYYVTPAGTTKIVYCEEWETDLSTYNNYSIQATFIMR